MTPERWRRIKQILDTVADVAPDDRASMLADACAGDADLRAAVDMFLLAEHENSTFLAQDAGTFLAPDMDMKSMATVAGPVELGQCLGPYRIEREIGEGGTSVVYLAERNDEQFQQKVAIKLLRQFGLARDERIGRFKAERQILASLQHPNIAQVYDGNVTDSGWPYLVMEYIKGTPITEYCDQQSLNIDTRLEIFAVVCEAVQHAHQRLVVHRDIKPSNILVTADGVVKLLDFGIAKLLGDSTDVSAANPATETGLRLLTPQYAAPEQIQGKAITTATDVYGLGVLLYEMLTGRRPYDLDGKSLSEVELIICETEPARPSVITSRDDDSGVVSQISTQHLRNVLRGDLDTIVLKALRKEPDLRYGSARELAADLQRYARGLPVEAQAATVMYRVRKFVLRNRRGVVSALAGIGLLASVVSFYTVRLQSERDQAQHEAERAGQITQFLIDVFGEADPKNAQGKTLDAFQILDRGYARIKSELSAQPARQADIQDAMGRVYRRLGSYERAQSLIEASLATRRKLYGEDHMDVAESLANLGWLYNVKGVYPKAKAYFAEALAIVEKNQGTDSTQWRGYTSGQGQVLLSMGEYKAAELLFRDALAASERAGGRLLGKIPFNTYLSRALSSQGKTAAALPFALEALSIARDVYGESHPDVAACVVEVASVYYNAGDLPSAERFFREALDLSSELYGENHPRVAVSYVNLAVVLTDQRRETEAIGLYLKALDLLRSRYGNRHPAIGAALYNLAGAYSAAGEYAQAVAPAREGLLMDRELLGNDHPSVGSDLSQLAGLIRETGNYQEALRLHQEGLAILIAKLPPQHNELGAAKTEYGITLVLNGEPELAEPLLREGLAVLIKKGKWTKDRAKSWLAASLTQVGQFEEAEALLLDGYQQLSALRGPEDRHAQQAAKHLAKLYLAWDKPELATKYLLP